MVQIGLTSIPGVVEVIGEPFQDCRGLFLNLFRHQDTGFLEIWGNRTVAQVNLSLTKIVGSLRGLHYQRNPHSEAKLVRCLRGRVWDVAVDLRLDSLTYGQWYGLELSPERANALMIPEGCAHGFQVLEADSEILYLHSGNWVPDAETGIRWDDPTLAVTWPLVVTEISDRDRHLPFLESP